MPKKKNENQFTGTSTWPGDLYLTLFDNIPMPYSHNLRVCFIQLYIKKFPFTMFVNIFPKLKPIKWIGFFFIVLLCCYLRAFLAAGQYRWNQYLFYKLRLATTNPRLGIRKMQEKSKWIWCQNTESQNWFHCMAFKSFWQSLARIVYIDF